MQQEAPLAYIKTNVMPPKKVLPVVFGVTGTSMAVMFLLIITGLPPVITMIIFLAVIFFGIFSFIYSGEYRLYEDRLEEKLTPKIKFSPLAKLRENTYSWKDTDSYLVDEDTSQYATRKYLRLYFKNPDRSVVIGAGDTEESRKQFAEFCSKFMGLLSPADIDTNAAEFMKEARKDAHIEETIEHSATINIPAGNIHAKPRKSFYTTAGAKVLAVIFSLITVAMVVIYFFPEMIGIKEFSPVSDWRLWAVVVPGTIYMVTRSFGGRNN